MFAVFFQNAKYRMKASNNVTWKERFWLCYCASVEMLLAAGRVPGVPLGAGPESDRPRRRWRVRAGLQLLHMALATPRWPGLCLRNA